jgi:hypothetical protein
MFWLALFIVVARHGVSHERLKRHLVLNFVSHPQVTGDDVCVQEASSGAGELLFRDHRLSLGYDAGKIFLLSVLGPGVAVYVELKTQSADPHDAELCHLGFGDHALGVEYFLLLKRVVHHPLKVFGALLPKNLWITE